MSTEAIRKALTEQLIDAALDSDASGRPDGGLADIAMRLRAALTAPEPAAPQPEQAAQAQVAEPASSIDHAQRAGYLGTPEQWREACRMFRLRCAPDDCEAMAKLRTYIEDGLLVVVRPADQLAEPAAVDEHAEALRIVHQEAGRTLGRDDFDMCMRMVKRALKEQQ